MNVNKTKRDTQNTEAPNKDKNGEQNSHTTATKHEAARNHCHFGASPGAGKTEQEKNENNCTTAATKNTLNQTNRAVPYGQDPRWPCVVRYLEGFRSGGGSSAMLQGRRYGGERAVACTCSRVFCEENPSEMWRYSLV